MHRLIFIAALGFTTAALAQTSSPPTPEAYVSRFGSRAQIVPAGEMTIDGKPVACKRVPTVLDPDLNDFALSLPGFIVLRPDVMRSVTTAVALWIYHHECAHIEGIVDESKADCFSVRRGKGEGWLTPQALEDVCAFISKGRASAVHLSGPARCAAMRQCFKEPAARSKPEAKR